MTFHWTATTLIVSALVLVITGGCCFVSWKRCGATRSVGLLELLRFVIVLLVLLTLNQPELVRQFRPDERPTLVVLHDMSGSMATRDAVDSSQPARRPQTREEAVQPLIQPEFWNRMAESMQVVIEPFRSRLASPEKGTDINDALLAAADRYPGLRGIVLLSDGDWNTGKPPSTAATSLRMKQIPVFAVGAGSEDRLPDIELTGLDAPTFGVAGKSMRLPFRIQNWLPGDRDLKVTLTGEFRPPAGSSDEGSPPLTSAPAASAVTTVEKTVRVSGMGELQETLEWRPETVGEYSLTLQIPMDAADTIPENNSLTFPVTIRNEALKVLLVESWPRWEYRYLRNALERDPGVDVNCLLFHPDLESVGGGRGYLEAFPDEKQLFEYDVVFLGDVGVESRQLTLEQCRQLRQLVRSHAGGLVFLPGFRGRQATLLTTPLEELYPVVPDPAQPRGAGSARPARYLLTESGRRSLLTRLASQDDQNEQTWKTLPGFQWHAAALRAKAGGEVLVTHDSESTRFGRVPLIVTRTSGTGKVLFMGTDAAWRWRKGVEDLYHYRFWSQVVRWMAYQRNMSQGDSMRLFHAPDRPEADHVLTLNANVMSATGEPLRDGTVVVQVRSPSGATDSVRLAPASTDSWGLFTGTFTPREGGLYSLTTTCAETGASLQTDVAVQGVERERVGQPARFDVLREIAEISRGRLVEMDQAARLVEEMAQMPEPDITTRRVRIWSHPAWGGLIVLLLTTFWVGRKLTGLA